MVTFGRMLRISLAAMRVSGSENGWVWSRVLEVPRHADGLPRDRKVPVEIDSPPVQAGPLSQAVWIQVWDIEDAAGRQCPSS